MMNQHWNDEAGDSWVVWHSRFRKVLDPGSEGIPMSGGGAPQPSENRDLAGQHGILDLLMDAWPVVPVS